ncbi:MAG: hypothetical protein N2D54_09710 [Chloroflexota bacterium]
MKIIRQGILGIAFVITLSSCNLPAGEENSPPQDDAPADTAIPENTATLSPTATDTPEPSATFTETLTPTITLTPTETLTPTPSTTPTPEALTANPNGNAHCRWGPGTAYLSSYGVTDEMTLLVAGRDYSAVWLWVQPPDIAWKCWVAASTVTVNGDPKSAPYTIHFLPVNGSVPAVSNVKAARNKPNVKITWNAAPAALEQHYLVEATHCQDGLLISFAYTTTNTVLVLQDNKNCGGQSYAEVRNVNKLGYSEAVSVKWPK